MGVYSLEIFKVSVLLLLGMMFCFNVFERLAGK